MMLEDLRKEVVRMAMEAENQGLCRRRSGNFSARDKDTGLMCITPSGKDRKFMRPEDIVVIDKTAHIAEAGTGQKPSSEVLMHLVAYEERADIGAVAHTHSPFAMVFAALERPIPGIVIEAIHLNTPGGKIPVVPFALQGSDALADSIRGPIREGDAVLLGRHGALTVGCSLEDAVLKAEYVEELAKIAYRAYVLGGGTLPAPLPQEVFAKSVRMPLNKDIR